MFNFAALTKIILALIISLCSVLINDSYVLFGLFMVELIVMIISGKTSKIGKAVVVLGIFSIVLYGIQLLCGSSVEISLISALRMIIMSYSVILMLATTKTQQITAALVKQCYMPYSYAFMVTAVLRFVPDILAESQAIREAQSCRGYRESANPIKRLMDYMIIIKPMVFRAIERSEHMAISLEMRGFSRTGQRTFMAETKLKEIDYSMLIIAMLSSVMLVSKF